MRTEDTGRYVRPHVDSSATLPPLPTPGIGATLLVAVTVLLLLEQGHPEDVAYRWRDDALAAIRSPSIPPEF